MITAVFKARDGGLYGFRISGHSGYSEAGSDIVCAAVSAMAFLTANTVTECFGEEADIRADETEAVMEMAVKSPSAAANGIIRGFLHEMRSLEEDYPEFVRVTVQ